VDGSRVQAGILASLIRRRAFPEKSLQWRFRRRRVYSGGSAPDSHRSSLSPELDWLRRSLYTFFRRGQPL